MLERYDFKQTISDRGLKLNPISIETLQLNVTKLCNQICVHCHVDASPKRREMMSVDVLQRCVEILKAHQSIKNLDITGGAPELHAEFRSLVKAAKAVAKHVMVRHNLTVTYDPHPLTKQSMEYLPEFFADEKVELISSLPCYTEELTNRQRGGGVFEKSIKSLQALNAKGFGKDGSGLVLNLVYNPVGTHLPPEQGKLELEYKRELKSHFGIEFNRLFAITNLPVHRFKAHLVQSKGYEAYMEKLMAAFNPAAAEGVMCRSLVSVGYDGRIYDCDFNQMLGMSIDGAEKAATVFDFDENLLLNRKIKFASHCFGCTAGAGSSCGGAVT